MIPLSEVTAAVLARARAVWPRVGDGEAPPDVTAPYAVLTVEPGPVTAGGPLATERLLTLRVRVTAVGVDLADPSSPGIGAAQSRMLADRLRAGLLDRTVPIAGTGWRVTGRVLEAHNGTDREGPVWNTGDDLLLLAAPT